MDTETITFLGLVVAGLITLLGTIISKIHEHKLSVLKILLENGYKEFEKREMQSKEKTLSFTEYIIFYKELAKTLTKWNVTEKDIEKTLMHNKLLIDSYYKNREKFRPDFHNE